jgi:hypothetical protein
MTANIPPRQDINHGMVAPKPPAPSGPHISAEVRADLGKLTPELAAEIRRVASTK